MAMTSIASITESGPALDRAYAILDKYGHELPRVYISGPYSSDPEANTRIALEVAERVVDMGADVFVPHLSHYRPSAQAGTRPYEHWLAEDLRWLQTCQVLYRLPGESGGAEIEEAWARHWGRSIVRNDKELAELLERTWGIKVLRPQINATP